MQKWPDPPPSQVARAVLRLRNWLRLAVANLLPDLTLFEDTIGAAGTQVLAVAARYRLADLLEEQPRTAPELAAMLGLQAEPLHRMMRTMSSRGYFHLERSGRFRNNRLSRALLSTNVERPLDFCEYFACASNTAAWLELDHVLRTGNDPFEHVHGQTVWDRHRERPDENRQFAQAMHARTILYAPAIATTYPFAELGSLCDVAGGKGALISEVALRHTHLKLALVDMEGVLAEADGFLQARRVSERIERIPGDIFHQVPSAYDGYLLKNVLHDWDDDRCVEILANIRHAMLPDSRLIIVEFVLEPNQADMLGAVSDLQMMVVTSGGRERSLAQFDSLLERSGLQRTRLWQTAAMSILEGRLAG
jgi:hypothetical protein